MTTKSGYKAFHLTSNGELHCRDYIFQIGKTYTEEEAILCQTGFHYCQKVRDVFTYYDPSNSIVVVCSITDLGGANTKFHDTKSCTTTIRIDALVNGIVDDCCFVNGRLHSEGKSAIVYSNGTTEWYKNGNVHREDDLPAVEGDIGKAWYKEGKLHREDDLPALLLFNGTKKWSMYGKLHREDDLPAIEWSDGTKEWYMYGKLHRYNNSPAIELLNGTKKWYRDGKLHREDDLPAIEWSNGNKEWYKNGKKYNRVWKRFSFFLRGVYRKCTNTGSTESSVV